MWYPAHILVNFENLVRLLLIHFIKSLIYLIMGFAGGSDGKEYACYAWDPGLIPGLGRSPGDLSSLGKGMATHSSILAWKIPRREEL